jgi:putative ABC transport system ATP-binding protein
MSATSALALEIPLLRAEHLGRKVGNKVIVDDVSFELHAAETLGILGPSGSGKSSLLRLLNRLDEPTSGTVFVEGVDYRSIAPRELRRKIGLVMQRPYLFSGTVEDNVRFGPEQRGEQVSSDAIAALLSETGLPGYATRNVAKLSGGEAQRVSLARALANSPSVLLLDEPTSALDDASKGSIETLVRTIVNSKKLGCVLVTHDRSQADRMASRLLRMEGGRILAGGEAC